MRRSTWNLPSDQEEGERSAPDRLRPTLVSLHFLRSALRSRLWVCILCGLLGLAAAVSFMLIFSLPHRADATLVLTYGTELDATSAMETNLSLLETRSVAVQAIEELGLTLDPEDFRRSIRAEQLSSELLSLTLTADTDAEAVRRLDALTRVYLDFRAEQLTLRSKVQIDGLRERIKQLQVEVNDLSRQIQRLSDDDSPNSASRLSDAIGLRANLSERIATLQEAVEDATLRNRSIVASSRVLDPPKADTGLARRNVVLGLASGLIGGVALGCGGVLFVAITSNRLRQRSDVAEALGVPVQISVRRVSAVPRAVRWLPVLRQISRARAGERERLAHALTEALRHTGTSRLAVIGLANTDELGFAVAVAARRIAATGRSTSVIDLTEHGSRGLIGARSTIAAVSGLNVLRSRGLAPLARDPSDLIAVDQWENGDRTPRPELGEVTLVLADFDPAVGVDHLYAWTDTAVVVVTAGRSSVERVRTIGDLIRSAGLDLSFAALLRTERTDDSSGLGLLPPVVDGRSVQPRTQALSETPAATPEDDLVVEPAEAPMPDEESETAVSAEDSQDEHDVSTHAAELEDEAEGAGTDEAQPEVDLEDFASEVPAPNDIGAEGHQNDHYVAADEPRVDNEAETGDASPAEDSASAEIWAKGGQTNHHAAADDSEAEHRPADHAPPPDRNGHHATTKETAAEVAGRTPAQ